MMTRKERAVGGSQKQVRKPRRSRRRTAASKALREFDLRTPSGKDMKY